MQPNTSNYLPRSIHLIIDHDGDDNDDDDGGGDDDNNNNNNGDDDIWSHLFQWLVHSRSQRVWHGPPAWWDISQASFIFEFVLVQCHRHRNCYRHCHRHRHRHRHCHRHPKAWVIHFSEIFLFKWFRKHVKGPECRIKEITMCILFQQHNGHKQEIDSIAVPLFTNPNYSETSKLV